MRLFLILAFLAIGLPQMTAQGIDFFEGTWEEAVEQATKQEKIIFVDAYAEWCGPCKRMAKNVFPQKEVGDFFNENFINMKLDMERGEGLKFRKDYPVSAFPTLFFIDFNGTIVHKVKGAQQAESLIKLGQLALRKIDRSVNYAEEYEKGNRDPKLVYDYVKALASAGKPSLKIANEYLRSQEDLATEQNLRFILVAATEADSRIFDMLIKNRKAIAALETEEVVSAQIEAACDRTLDKAIEYESPDLLGEAKAKMKEHCSEKAEDFALKADRDYYRETGDPENYLKACTACAKEKKGNAAALNDLAKEMAGVFSKYAKCLVQAEKIAKKAADKGDSYEYHYTYAVILDRNGKKSEAIKAANKSLKLAKETKGAERTVMKLEHFIRALEG